MEVSYENLIVQSPKRAPFGRKFSGNVIYLKEVEPRSDCIFSVKNFENSAINKIRNRDRERNENQGVSNNAKKKCGSHRMLALSCRFFLPWIPIKASSKKCSIHYRLSHDVAVTFFFWTAGNPKTLIQGK